MWPQVDITPDNEPAISISSSCINPQTEGEWIKKTKTKTKNKQTNNAARKTPGLYNAEFPGTAKLGC